MMGRKKDSIQDERLDNLGRAVVRASAMNEEEAERAASSPFLYARVRSRIAAEKVRREEGERWLALLGVAWRAVPAMALVAIFALALFVSTSLHTQSSAGFSVEAMLGERDAGVEQVVFTDRQPLSSDEVLATILTEDEQGVSR